MISATELCSDYYDRTSRRSSITFEKINPNLMNTYLPRFLSYLRQDEFSTQKRNDAIFSKPTFIRAKRMVMSTVNSPDPRESLVYIYNDRIIHSVIGEQNHVGSNNRFLKALLYNPDVSVASMHSHPHKSTPSFQDFLNLNKRPGQKSTYVITPDGDYYVLRKTSDKRPSKKTIEKVQKEYQQLLDELNKKRDILAKKSEGLKIIYDMDMSFVEKFYEFESEDEIIRRFNRAQSAKCQIDCNKIENLYNHLFDKHRFWLEHAKELGIEVETDYSEFKGINFHCYN